MLREETLAVNLFSISCNTDWMWREDEGKLARKVRREKQQNTESVWGGRLKIQEFTNCRNHHAPNKAGSRIMLHLAQRCCHARSLMSSTINRVRCRSVRFQGLPAGLSVGSNFRHSSDAQFRFRRSRYFFTIQRIAVEIEILGRFIVLTI